MSSPNDRTEHARGSRAQPAHAEAKQRAVPATSFRRLHQKYHEIIHAESASFVSHDAGTFPRSGIRHTTPTGAESRADMETARPLDRRQIIGPNIRRLRELRHMRQRRLAELSKMSQPHLSEAENGKREPNWEQMIRIAHALGIVDPGWFYCQHPDLDLAEDAA